MSVWACTAWSKRTKILWLFSFVVLSFFLPFPPNHLWKRLSPSVASVAKTTTDNPRWISIYLLLVEDYESLVGNLLGAVVVAVTWKITSSVLQTSDKKMMNAVKEEYPNLWFAENVVWMFGALLRANLSLSLGSLVMNLNKQTPLGVGKSFLMSMIGVFAFIAYCLFGRVLQSSINAEIEHVLLEREEKNLRQRKREQPMEQTIKDLERKTETKRS